VTTEDVRQLAAPEPSDPDGECLGQYREPDCTQEVDAPFEWGTVMARNRHPTPTPRVNYASSGSSYSYVFADVHIFPLAWIERPCRYRTRNSNERHYSDGNDGYTTSNLTLSCLIRSQSSLVLQDPPCQTLVAW
jgi:hypothetical protein